jgi:hypothetical protein
MVGKFLSNVGKFLSEVIDWIAFSSTDPTKTSLTVKAFLTALVTYGTMLAGFGDVKLPISQLNGIVDLIVQLVQAILMTVSIGIALYGAIRKIYLTLTDKNQAVP